MVISSGEKPFAFTHRNDLHTIPVEASDYEVNLHGGFAVDKRINHGQIYYGMPKYSILRIDPDMKKQELIPLPDKLKPLNFHMIYEHL